ncbi:MAG: hypothetical protein IPK17_15705 [Chloroflexi bacterium]|uniref:hypothetical protein n=1 Tax=Candidatus Flexifilum breve TaxID=3140694 RepID=UPI0031364202|nr:hypothetical protein [Chloroflexota bacterium]
MVDKTSHIAQAHHNQDFADFVLNQTPVHRDWAITAAFYAAVHFTEACFAAVPSIQHTETAPDRGKLDKHAYRQEKIRKLAPSAYKNYRKLREASQDLRYLDPTKTLSTYYTGTVAEDYVRVILPQFRTLMETSFKTKL